MKFFRKVWNHRNTVLQHVQRIPELIKKLDVVHKEVVEHVNIIRLFVREISKTVGHTKESIKSLHGDLKQHGTDLKELQKTAAAISPEMSTQIGTLHGRVDHMTNKLSDIQEKLDPDEQA